VAAEVSRSEFNRHDAVGGIVGGRLKFEVQSTKCEGRREAGGEKGEGARLTHPCFLSKEGSMVIRVDPPQAGTPRDTG
jgi:hypothetical protein